MACMSTPMSLLMFSETRGSSEVGRIAIFGTFCNTNSSGFYKDLMSQDFLANIAKFAQCRVTNL